MNTSKLTERGVYVAHADYILNTVTGEYYEASDLSVSRIEIEGVERKVISFFKDEEGREMYYVQTDDKLYSIELDEIVYEIFISWLSREEEPIGEIAIQNNELVAIEY